MPLNNSTQESHTNENYNAETNSKQLKFSFLSLRLNKFSVSLLGFSLLLFVIATNTQSGWLFILISLLLSSLLVDGLQALITVMRAIDTLKLSISPTSPTGTAAIFFSALRIAVRCWVSIRPVQTKSKRTL